MTVPASRKPNPRRESPRMASAFLSNPAARPMGLEMREREGGRYEEGLRKWWGLGEVLAKSGTREGTERRVMAS